MPEIAVVGLACELPEASSPLQLWENCLATRRAFRRLPDVRLNRSDYLDREANDPDKTYLEHAALIEGYAFDRVRHRISRAAYEQADLAHWLALDVAGRALSDAGFDAGAGLERTRVGVVLGNSLTGEFSRANVLRLRWPFVRRALDAALCERGEAERARRALLAQAERAYKASFPVPDAESLAGGLANTIAGRVANYYDFGGGCYTVDGACASSLLAVAHGCRALQAGEWDAVVVGGVDLSIDPFELVGFARNGALARDDMRVFDARAQGFWPGEGCGMAVLMRRADAQQAGVRVYATVRGWGLSSDGEGGLTRPKLEKQALALRRCYELAGYRPSEVAYFEGHGTGTRVGDEVELQAVASVLAAAGPAADTWVPSIGSIKELIGHTKAAAGIAGFIKACMTAHSGLIAPGRYTDTPHALFSRTRTLLVRAQAPRAWESRRPLRVSVSSMGFGGINVHATIEAERQALHHSTHTPRARQLLATARSAELLAFAAPNVAQLTTRLRALQARAAELSISELTDLAEQLAPAATSGKVRLAIVTRSSWQLQGQLDRALVLLEEGAGLVLDRDAGIFLDTTLAARNVGLLFPGQGAPVRERSFAFEALAGACDELYAALTSSAARDTAAAQPAIMAASLSGLRLLQRVGLRAVVAIGHSLGELAAWVWAGSLEPLAAIRLAAERGRVMSQHGSAGCGMLALRCDHELAGRCLAGTSASIACFNGPRDVVIAAELQELERVRAQAEQQGVQASQLAVSHAFHSPHMREAVEPFRAVLREHTPLPPQRRVLSTISGGPLEQHGDLRELLVAQLVEPVRFDAARTAAGDVDLWIEVGPGTTLAATATGSNGHVLAMDIGSADVLPTLQTLAAAYVCGAIQDLEPLGAERCTRPFSLERTRSFFQNPCERVPESPWRDEFVAQQSPEPQRADLGDEAPARDAPALLEALKRKVAEATEIPAAAIGDDDRLLSDLHLNSLLVTQLLTNLGQRFAPGDRDFARAAMKVYRDVSLAQLAAHLATQARKHVAPSGASEALDTAALPAWVHAFVEREQPLRQVQTIAKPEAGNSWQVLGPDVGRNAALQAVLCADPTPVGNGVVVCADAADEAEQLALFLEAVRTASLDERLEHCVVLARVDAADSAPRRGRTASLFPALRTLALERPSLRCSALALTTIDARPELASLIKREAALCSGYHEVIVDAAGRRACRVFEPVFLSAVRRRELLGTRDVVLVTGGGKGITYEAAAHLARTTGAALALLGRASPDCSPELQDNLARLDQEGLRYHYVRADVCDAAAVRCAVAEAEALLGPISGVLHGAGRNEPAPIAEQSVDKWRDTHAVKVAGLGHCMAALEGRNLRMIVTFGSIIAESGLHGELDYALANEALAQATQALAGQFPSSRVLCLEWSVWSGTGMGENLNTLELLKQQGVSAIAIDDGLRLFDQCLHSETQLPVRVLIAARYANLPTLAYAKVAKPRGVLRFVGTPIVSVPGIELVTETELSRDTDCYLDLHVFHGQRLLPAVVAFEMMAQHVASLLPQFETLRLVNARFDSPISAPELAKLRVRVAATRVGERRFVTSVRSESTGFAVESFRAEVEVEVGTTTRTEPAPAQPSSLLPIGMDEDVYDPLLFHHGAFRTLTGFESLHQDGCRARLQPHSDARWFGPGLAQTLVLSDIGSNDAVLHAFQACIPEHSVLPASVDAVTFTHLGRPAGARRLQLWERTRSADGCVVDAAVWDDAGALVQSWQGVHLRQVAGAALGMPAPALLHVYLERLLTRLGAAPTVHLEAMGQLQSGEARLLSSGAESALHVLVYCEHGERSFDAYGGIAQLVERIQQSRVSAAEQAGKRALLEIVRSCTGIEHDDAGTGWLLSALSGHATRVGAVQPLAAGRAHTGFVIAVLPDPHHYPQPTGDDGHANRATRPAELLPDELHDDLR